ncbi:DUF3040 domain-containing protein [Longispora albida]|uniref:DUF3040 domain-containing protein n=1 Tax=Longispora albida TaxID=203523 RepID=UPI000369B56A|nr:DUF3040 domain-containing protein [Longispora albida]
MPLSEHEQRLFEEIERSLADDPKFASAVRASDPGYRSRRRLVAAGGLLVVGLALLIFGTVSNLTLLGVAGFVVMLGAAAFGLQSQRRAHRPELRAVGGQASRRTRQRRSSIVDRLEERWRRRMDDH